jgi:hypothetical protein
MLTRFTGSSSSTSLAVGVSVQQPISWVISQPTSLAAILKMTSGPTVTHFTGSSPQNWQHPGGRYRPPAVNKVGYGWTDGHFDFRTKFVGRT